MKKYYPHVSSAINLEMEFNDFSSKFLAEQLRPYMGLASNAAKVVIHDIRNGYVYATTGTPRDPEKRLGWTAILLNALNFSERYPEIIDEIKRDNSGFKFPPDNGISYLPFSSSLSIFSFLIFSPLILPIINYINYFF